LVDAGINPKHEIPAFAEAATRRQAKLETIANDQNSKFETDQLKTFLKFGHLNFEGILRQAQDGERSRTISDFDIRI